MELETLDEAPAPETLSEKVAYFIIYGDRLQIQYRHGAEALCRLCDLVPELWAEAVTLLAQRPKLPPVSPQVLPPEPCHVARRMPPYYVDGFFATLWYCREYEDEIFIRAQDPETQRWGNRSLARLDPFTWADTVCGFFERGVTPTRLKRDKEITGDMLKEIEVALAPDGSLSVICPACRAAAPQGHYYTACPFCSGESEEGVMVSIDEALLTLEDCTLDELGREFYTRYMRLLEDQAATGSPGAFNSDQVIHELYMVAHEMGVHPAIALHIFNDRFLPYLEVVSVDEGERRRLVLVQYRYHGGMPGWGTDEGEVEVDKILAEEVAEMLAEEAAEEAAE